MTKELELFKRWFGTKSNIPNGTDISFYKTYYKGRDDAHPPYKAEVMVHMTDWVKAKEYKDLLIELIESPYFVDLGYAYGPVIDLTIPTQFHHEWEQYVKERK